MLIFKGRPATVPPVEFLKGGIMKDKVFKDFKVIRVVKDYRRQFVDKTQR